MTSALPPDPQGGLPTPHEPQTAIEHALAAIGALPGHLCASGKSPAWDSFISV